MFFSPCSIQDKLDLSRSASPYCPLSRASRSTSPLMAKRACKQKRASKQDETDAALLHTLGVLAARPNKEKGVDPDTYFRMELTSCLRRLPPRQNALAKIRLQVVFYLEYPSTEYMPTPVAPTNTIDNSYYEY